MTTTGTQSKLFGMTCVMIDPRDRTSMIELADLDRATSAKPLSAASYRLELGNPLMACYGIIGPDNHLLAFAMVRRGDLAATITNLVVRNGYRRQGVGGMLVNCVRKKCLTGTRKFLDAVVSDANVGAHLFLKACGFHGEVIRDEKCDCYLFRATKTEDCK